MAKLVDASDLNSDDYYNHAGSIPALSTFINLKTIIMGAKKSIRAWVAIALIIILIATVSISKYCADYDYYNYVELKVQYKNYIVTNKYVRNSDTYVLELMNPFSKKTKEVYVRYYLYYNTYFVGDTIK